MNHDHIQKERTREEIADVRDRLIEQSERARSIARDEGHYDIEQAAQLAGDAAIALDRALKR